MSIDREWEMVHEFHNKFDAPYKDKPELLSEDRVQKRYSWMLEEIDEFAEADNIIDQADAMIDLIYFALGTMVEMGVKPAKLFEIVHDANMKKIWPDGKVHRAVDGKVIKSPEWKDPYPMLEKQIELLSKE
ncbi:MAG: HAD family hydrolase [Clostridiales bacterium GWF2_38_85]|nr:MAG: HAD family hydrolase [Clostridiales bacterium GWF2_38_85]HBL85307.1 HAD family hydrolase [Clostridiales bacterium]